ncbi:hypothetical protein FS749_009769, partial [Ceratobasidium sp. UAMH 11750]
KSIKYYGDKDPAGGIATVRIDGQQYTNVSLGAAAFAAQQALWTSPALDSGDHQIVISNIGARVNPKKPVVGLDFFEIVPNDGSGDVVPSELGPGASSVPDNAILVDNTDPSISYGGNGWQPKVHPILTSLPVSHSLHPSLRLQTAQFTSAARPTRPASLPSRAYSGLAGRLFGISQIIRWVMRRLWSALTADLRSRSIRLRQVGLSRDRRRCRGAKLV